MNRLIKLCLTTMFFLSLFITGCTSLKPDRMGISFNQARYREEDAAYRGFGINFQWDLNNVK